jgi:SCY1-like protein 2
MILYFLIILVCDDCDKLYKGDCPEHGPLEWIKTTRAMDSTPYTPSVASLPDGLVLKESGIPDNDMGVFAARLIYKRTMFGPFAGIKIPSTEIPEGKDLTYSWDVSVY